MKATQPQTTDKKQTKRAGAPTGPRKADHKRAALIEVARRLFESRGYESTTMDDIAAAADVAKGTLYHYFSNKVDFLKALREDFEKEIMSRIKHEVETVDPDDWSGKLRAWVYSAVAGYFDLNELHDVVVYGQGMPFRNAMADAEITKYLKTLIHDGAAAGAWDIEDANWTSVVMFYSFRGGCDEAIIGTQSPESVPIKLYNLFQRILGI